MEKKTTVMLVIHVYESRVWTFWNWMEFKQAVVCTVEVSGDKTAQVIAGCVNNMDQTWLAKCMRDAGVEIENRSHLQFRIVSAVPVT